MEFRNIENDYKHKKELERIILKVMITEIEFIPEILSRLKESDFTGSEKEVFKFIQNNFTEYNDSAIFQLNLGKRNIKNYSLSEITEFTSKYYEFSYPLLLAKNLLIEFKDLAIKHNTIKILQQNLSNEKNTYSGLEFIEKIKADLENLEKEKEDFKDVKNFSEKIPEIINRLEDKLKNNSKDVIKFGNLPSFSNTSNGFNVGNLIGIAGSEKSGKTTLAINLSKDLVLNNIPVCFFSLELSQNEIEDKFLSNIIKVSYDKIREPKNLDTTDVRKLNESKSMQIPLYIDTDYFSDVQIFNRIKFYKDKFNIKVFFIDYIGFIQTNKKFERNDLRIGYISTSLKRLAKELKVIIFVLMHLNRAGKENPTSNNLAESIAFSRDCDFLYLIYKSNDSGSNENYHYVKLDISRHSKSNQKFMIEIEESGNIKEITKNFDNIPQPEKTSYYY